MSLFGLEEATKFFCMLNRPDMRKGFDGLYGLVLECLELVPRCGYLFVFLNSQRTRIKVLHWNNDGLALFHKRLERGRIMTKCWGLLLKHKQSAWFLFKQLGIVQ